MKSLYWKKGMFSVLEICPTVFYQHKIYEKALCQSGTYFFLVFLVQKLNDFVFGNKMKMLKIVRPYTDVARQSGRR